jgi:hypothetical protein
MHCAANPDARAGRSRLCARVAHALPHTLCAVLQEVCFFFVTLFSKVQFQEKHAFSKTTLFATFLYDRLFERLGNKTILL